ncbi:pyruvate kinase [Plakobranchus ocellatus]|uniref:Pyruvate kinase n=1 Tax=Plakobranchus ocellatus TaxID=259542 RepID=A0AAV3ZW81_9GAST|nr:pyruvate kinase [Plakobranchus ocellatus]
MQGGSVQQEMFMSNPGLNRRQTHLQQICSLNVDVPQRTCRMTNIVCTVGPSCESTETLCNMVASGMNICRFNMAHATHEWHLRTLQNLRQAIVKMQRSHSAVATAIDITGPGVRLGQFSEDIEVPVHLSTGATITMSGDKSIKKSCTKEKVYVIPGFIERAKVGDEIFIDDGPLCFKVTKKVSASEMLCEVVHSGEMHHKCLAHIPMTTPIMAQYLSEKDKKDIKFCVDNGVDMVFVSWVLEPEMITAVRDALGDAKDKVMVVAKIESYSGVKRIDDILKVADGILIARGDLGNDIPPEKVFLAQKMIIGRANLAGVPVICAAQMLESMVSNARPTRAEASDVANAILDGADCVMLSRETALGRDPARVVHTLAQICQEAENALYHDRTFRDLRLCTALPTDRAHATAISAVEAAIRGSASAIIVVTNSGRSARLIARYRPHCVIIAITKSQYTARHLNLHRGVFTVLHTGTSAPEWYLDVDNRIHNALRVAMDQGYVKPQDKAILVTGHQAGPGSTNTIRSIIIPRREERPCFLAIAQCRTDDGEDSCSD